MRIHVEFMGLPMISEVLGKKKLEVDITGNTVNDVIDELISSYGKKLKDLFYDEEGNFDVMIQITLNGKVFIPANKHDTSLNEGDSLLFMLLLAGG